MKVLTAHEPFLIEFTREELSQVEETLHEARMLSYRHAKELLDKTELGQRLDPQMFVAHIDTVLDALDPLELWDDERYGPSWDHDHEDYEDDEYWEPGLPCHLMTPPPEHP